MNHETSHDDPFDRLSKAIAGGKRVIVEAVFTQTYFSLCLYKKKTALPLVNITREKMLHLNAESEQTK